MIPDPAAVLALVDAHVARYTDQLRRARAGDPACREAETTALLSLWLSIDGKGGVWGELTEDERMEALGALEEEREANPLA